MFFFFRARANVLTTRLRRLEGNVQRVKRIARTDDDAFHKSRAGLSRKKKTTTTTTKLRAKKTLAQQTLFKALWRRRVSRPLSRARRRRSLLESTYLETMTMRRRKVARCFCKTRRQSARFRRLFRRLFRLLLLLLLVVVVIDRKKRREESLQRATGRTRSVAEKRGFGTGFSVGKDEGKERL